MAVDVRTSGDAFSPGIPRVLFKSRAMFGDHLGNVYAYDVSSDGRFLINERLSDAQRTCRSPAVLNWTAGLAR
jgi:hypothetical protein